MLGLSVCWQSLQVFEAEVQTFLSLSIKNFIFFDAIINSKKLHSIVCYTYIDLLVWK